MKSSNLKPLQLADLSRYKNEIYGISILWIMIFHCRGILKFDFDFGLKILQPLDAFIGFGNMGVEIFLFCSGIFLYFSFFNNNNILVFIKKRLSRLFWPVIIINGLYWAYKYLFAKHTISVFLSKLTMLDFWFSGDQQIWFVSCILVCYLIYPFIYSYLFDNNFLKTPFLRLLVLLAVTAILTLTFRATYPQYYANIEIALTRFPVFFIGCYFGKLVYEKRTFTWYANLICLLLVVFAFIVLGQYVLGDVWLRWFYLVGGIPLTFVIVWLLNLLKCKPLNKFFAFLGSISLNLYISHIMIIRIYKSTSFYEDKNLFHFVILMILFVGVAYVAQLLIKVITKRNKKTTIKN